MWLFSWVFGAGCVSGSDRRSEAMPGGEALSGGNCLEQRRPGVVWQNGYVFPASIPFGTRRKKVYTRNVNRPIFLNKQIRNRQASIAGLTNRAVRRLVIGEKDRRHSCF